MSIVNARNVYIANGAFKDTWGVTSIDMNNTPFVNNDGSMAFSSMSYLTNVTNISNQTTNLGGAFAGCNALTTIPDIPNSVTQTAFVKTHNSYYGFTPDENTEIFVPWTEAPALGWFFDGPVVSGARVNAWYNYYDEDEEKYSLGEIEDVYILSVDGQNISVYTYDEENPEIITRNAESDFDGEPFMFPTITGLFENCSNITNVPSLPNGVTNMQGMFSGCKKLTEVPDIPDSVTNMSESFAFCRNITNIKFGNNVTDLSGAYACCYAVTEIPEIPASVTNIGSAFTGMVRLNTMPHIPNTVVNAVYKGTGTPAGAYGPASYAYPLNKPFVDRYNRSYNTCYLRSKINTAGRTYVYVINLDEAYSSFSQVANTVTVSGDTISFTNNGVTYSGTRTPDQDIYVSSSFEDESTDSYDRAASGAFEDCVRFTDATDIDDGGLINMDLMFHGCANLVNAFIPSSVQSMACTFESCDSLTTSPVIPNSVTNMHSAFYGAGLTSAPVIPDSVIDMSKAYMCCYDMTNGAATIGNSVVNMYQAFQQCNVMTVGPSVIPNSVTNLAYCFHACDRLTTIPSDISSSVTNMDWTFNGCSNMRGRTNIYSTEVQSADNCFRNCNNSLQKNVYIPFTYQNGEHTNTYNAFINAGYSTSSRVRGAQLFDLGVQG